MSICNICLSVECYGKVESVNAASNLYMPLKAEIIERNMNVIQNPRLINKSPSDEGRSWLNQFNSWNKCIVTLFYVDLNEKALDFQVFVGSRALVLKVNSL